MKFFTSEILHLYTLYAGETNGNRDGELYILELKFIALAIRGTGYICCSGIPSTVGGSWMKAADSSLRISFAFSCVGLTPQVRHEENASRRHYMDYLYSVKKVVD